VRGVQGGEGGLCTEVAAALDSGSAEKERRTPEGQLPGTEVQGEGSGRIGQIPGYQMRSAEISDESRHWDALQIWGLSHDARD